MSDVNGVMMQYFHWYVPEGGEFWTDVKSKASQLAQAGISAVWLPPAYKGAGGGYDVGYGVYDLFDLGEFDQKGTVPTKYGSKSQYEAAVAELQAQGVEVYADVVLNHKDGGDETEVIRATPFHRDNRAHSIGGLQDIEAYTRFTFPGRGDRYSSMKWDHWQFDAVNYNNWNPDEKGVVYLLEGRSFDEFVSLEKGNYDFLLGCDLDMSNEQVRGELLHWGKWYLDTVPVNGFRLDAIKHIPAWFFSLWLDEMRQHVDRPLFAMGEYWSTDLASLHWYLEATGGRMSVMDVPLQNRFHVASKVGGLYDMRYILEDTLVKQQPSLAVTFVDNHDTQPLQSLENWVEGWFKPLAYSLILLRREGYPCVFYGDYYGAHYVDKGREIWLDRHQWLIDKFLYARHNFAYGDQYDYFDHPNRIGWTRLGSDEHPQAMAVLMSNGPGGSKWMEVGRPHTTFRDITEHVNTVVQTNEHGWGEFHCDGGSVSVWVQEAL